MVAFPKLKVLAQFHTSTTTCISCIQIAIEPTSQLSSTSIWDMLLHPTGDAYRRKQLSPWTTNMQQEYSICVNLYRMHHLPGQKPFRQKYKTQR